MKSVQIMKDNRLRYVASELEAGGIVS